jgi:hypothetical protein
VQATLQAETRVQLRIERLAHDEFVTDGDAFLGWPALVEIGEEEGASEQVVEHVVRRFVDEGLLATENWHLFRAGSPMVLQYELEHDRPEHWRRNVLRRVMLLAAARAYEEGEETQLTREGRGSFAEHDWEELWAAAVLLEDVGLIARRRSMGAIGLLATAEGYDVARDDRELASRLPTSPAEDEAAHAQVAADALGQVIRSVEELLRARHWDNALDELGQGDDQYGQSHWADAVGEYYSSLESALKYRLTELGVNYGESGTLRDLAREAAKTGAIPRNYQALFEFADSIRSPRRHGAGPVPQKVEIGPAEALLMGNHVRALLLYLGHRPR